MSEQINDGGPSFPSGNPEGDGQQGMTLRDYFAAAALTGLIASCSGETADWPLPSLTADKAYDYADWMLKARNEAAP